MRDRSVKWLWNAYHAVDNVSLVKKISLAHSQSDDFGLTHIHQQVFELCVVWQGNLSYECLTGFEARSALRNMRSTDPEFWAELTTKKLCDCVPAEDEAQAEDVILDPDNKEGDAGNVDYSDLPVKEVIGALVDGTCPEGMVAREEGGFRSTANAERLDDVDVVVESNFGASVLSTAHRELGCASLDLMILITFLIR